MKEVVLIIKKDVHETHTVWWVYQRVDTRIMVVIPLEKELVVKSSVQKGEIYIMVNETAIYGDKVKYITNVRKIKE